MRSDASRRRFFAYPGAARRVRFWCISFLVGVGSGSMLLDRLAIRDALSGIMIIAVVLAVAKQRHALYILCTASLGLVWMLSYHALQAMPAPGAAPVQLTGEIRFVELMIRKQRLTVRLDSNRRNVYVYTERYPSYRVGTSVSFLCALKKPEAFNDFAYDRFASRQGIAYLCQYPTLTVVGFRETLRTRLFDVKEFYSVLFNRAFHEPENGLAQAMVLNRSGEFSPRIRDAFSRAGIVHVISISGLHMALLAVVAESLLCATGVGRRNRLIAIALGCVAYLLFLGFPAAAVRSAIMVLLLLGARLAGRAYDGMHVLILTAAAMVMQNPYILQFDIGFQLSFTALAGLMLTGEHWEQLLRFLPERWSIRSVTAMTMAAQFFTWPLTAYYFHSVSLVAPAANLAILALVAPVLIGAFAMPLALVPVIGPVIAWPTFFMLKACIAAARYGSALPFAALAMHRFTAAALIISYGAMIGLYYCLKKYVSIR